MSKAGAALIGLVAGFLGNMFITRMISTPPPMQYNLDIRSIPTGASVWFNFKSIGDAPTMIKVEEAEHHIRFEMSGYDSIATDFMVGQDLTVVGNLDTGEIDFLAAETMG